MGEFDAGKGVVWILVYFALLFVVVFSMINSLDEYENDHEISVSDPGFMSRTNPFNSDGSCDSPSRHFTLSGGVLQYVTTLGQKGNYVREYYPCGELGASNIYNCEYFPDCNWTNVSTFLGFNYDTDYFCDGEINLTNYGYEPELLDRIIGYNFCMLEGLQNRTACETIGCTWYSYEDMTEKQIDSQSSFSLKSVSDTIMFVTGLKVNLGIPSGYQWLFSLTFFWIPFVYMLICLYFALPLLH